MNEPKTYTLPAGLVQATLNLLNEMPAKMSRTLINALELECGEQDVKRANEQAPRGLE